MFHNPAARALSTKFLLGGKMGGAHSECEDFAKECTEKFNRPISHENTLLSFGSSINLTSREKVSVHWGN